MSIIFDEIAHTYTDDRTGEQLTPVNYLINKVYGSGYEYVKKSILESRANRGREIHLDAHNWMTIDGYYGMKHIETRALVGWLERNDISLKDVESEKIVSVSGMFAGTADLVTGTARKAQLWDYKTNLNKPTKKMISHWKMQLSFYKYALEKMGYNVEKMTILHLSGTNCTPYELEYLGDKFVEETVQAYKEGKKIEEKHTVTALTQVNRRAVAKLEKTLKKIATLEKQIAPIRESIKEEMEKRGIDSLKLGQVAITYIGPGKRKSFDTKRFKAENEGLYERYVTETEVKSQIRIKVDEKND
jgi:hypothetical protein